MMLFIHWLFWLKNWCFLINSCKRFIVSWNLNSIGNSWGSSYIPVYLLLIIKLPFTCGEEKIFSIIKKSKLWIWLQNFLLLFMSLLTVLIVKKQLYFSCNLLCLSKIASCIKLERWKDWQSSLVLFLKLLALILGQNCVEGLGVTKIVKQLKFEKF